MQLKKARVLGYCMGVRRAVEISLAAAPGAFTIGPLIHNRRVLADLEKAGVQVAAPEELPEDLSGVRLIIRAHGIPPPLEEALRLRGALLIDATCPRVKASQTKAAALRAEGWEVFLAGDREHAEIISILGYAPGCMVVSSPEEARLRAAGLQPPWALLGQTTLSPGEFGQIACALREICPSLAVIDTICPATRERQEALRELCAEVDGVVIAGGRDSANTQRLFAIAKGLGKEAWLVESAPELPEEVFRLQSVGLSAGASTPDEVIKEIEAALGKRRLRSGAEGGGAGQKAFS